jgi:hypothetical protein
MLIRRLVRNAAVVAALIVLALGMGATGYHMFDGLPWLDAVLDALFSGVFFLTMVAVLLAQALHHFLHRFHLDLSRQRADDQE